MKFIHKVYRKINPDPKVKFLDNLCIVISFILPLASLPQVYEIYRYHDAEGVSLLTWVIFVVCEIPLLIYGIVHRILPIMILYSFWILFDIAIVIGILIYNY